MEPRVCVCLSARQRAWGQRELLTSTSCLVRMLHMCTGSVFCYSSVLPCFCCYRIRRNRLFWRAPTLSMSNFAFQDRYSSSSKTEVDKNQLLGTPLCVSCPLSGLGPWVTFNSPPLPVTLFLTCPFGNILVHVPV